MEIFWVVVGVVVVILFIINQNRTKTSDKTVVTHTRTIKTEDGEINVHRTQVVDSASTTYHTPGAASVSSKTKYDISAIDNYNRQTSIQHQERAIPEPRQPIDVSPTRITPEKEPVRLAPPAITSSQAASIEERKKCPRCSRNLPMSKFRLSSKQPDGHTIWCGECLDAPRNTKHMKYCPKCKKRRMKTSFYPNSNRKDGLTLWCKDCMDKSK